MEIAIIAIVAVVAFGAVLIPLFRRDARADAREFAVDSGVAVRDASPLMPPPPGASLTGEDEIEREVLRYRVAVRAGTVCGACGQANPDDAGFCFECGRRLPRSAAKEFE